MASAERCWRCHRPLADPESRARGAGPVCAGKMTERDWQEMQQSREATIELLSAGKEDAILMFHEIANEYPLMGGQEFAELVEDIRENGLMEPIVLYEGKVLDGRNRYRACLEAGVEPVTVEYEGSSPREFVDSMNMFRRHLTPGQVEEKRAQRRQRALELRQAGASYRQIGEELGVTHTQARADVQEAGALESDFTMPSEITTADGRSYPAERPVKFDVVIFDHTYEKRGPAYESVEIPRSDADDWLKVYQIVSDTWPEPLLFVRLTSYAWDAYLAAGQNVNVILDEAREMEQEPAFYHEIVTSPGGGVDVVAVAGHEFLNSLRPHLLASGFEVVTYLWKRNDQLNLECVQAALERDEELYYQQHGKGEDPADPAQPPGWVAGEPAAAPTRTSETVPGAPIPGLPLEARHDHLLVTLHSIAISLDTVMELLKEAALDEDQLDSAVARSLLHSAQHSITPIREMVNTLVAEGALDELRQHLAEVEAAHDGEHSDKVIADYLWQRRPKQAAVVQPSPPLGELFDQGEEAVQ